jgi:TonB family protein
MSVTKMISKTVLSVAFVLLGMSASLAVAREPVQLAINWDLSLNSDGSIEKLSLVGTAPDALREQLEATIRKWDFDTGVINGKPIASTTTLTVKLTLDPVDSDLWSTTIVGAHTGARLKSGWLPNYPSAAAKDRRDGVVLVLGDFDSEGRVIAAKIHEGSPVSDGRLVGAAISAVKRFTMLPEQVGGRAVAGQFIVPVCFILSGGNTGKKTSCRWEGGKDGSPLNGGEALALSPAVELKTNVAGSIL